VSEREQAEDLKATAEDLIDDAEKLKKIERRKMTLEPGDPLLVELAEEASAIVARMQPKSQAQEELATSDKGA
jgi:hypothetical protein